MFNPIHPEIIFFIHLVFLFLFLIIQRRKKLKLIIEWVRVIYHSPTPIVLDGIGVNLVEFFNLLLEMLDKSEPDIFVEYQAHLPIEIVRRTMKFKVCPTILCPTNGYI